MIKSRQALYPKVHSVGDAQSNEPYQAAISVIPACLMERTTQTGLLLLLQCEICPALIDWTERKMARGRTIDEVDQVSKRQAAGVKLELKFEIYRFSDYDSQISLF